jgi:hypothetical protein
MISTSPPFPTPTINMSRPDRAAVVATAILQIVEATLRAALHGDGNDDGCTMRAALEATLRDEFADIALAALHEIRPDDG